MWQSPDTVYHFSEGTKTTTVSHYSEKDGDTTHHYVKTSSIDYMDALEESKANFENMDSSVFEAVGDVFSSRPVCHTCGEGLMCAVFLGIIIIPMIFLFYDRGHLDLSILLSFCYIMTVYVLWCGYQNEKMDCIPSNNPTSKKSKKQR